MNCIRCNMKICSIEIILILGSTEESEISSLHIFTKNGTHFATNFPIENYLTSFNFYKT